MPDAFDEYVRRGLIALAHCDIQYNLEVALDSDEAVAVPKVLIPAPRLWLSPLFKRVFTIVPMNTHRFAEHAFAGSLHLDTRPSGDEWEWEVFEVKTRKRIAEGTVKNFEDAKAAAETAAREAGFTGPFEWKGIGSPLS